VTDPPTSGSPSQNRNVDRSPLTSGQPLQPAQASLWGNPHWPTAMTPATDNHDWSLDSLNKAYQQGYMAGLTGQPQHLQPHPAEVLAAAWEAGWDDGNEQFKQHQRRSA
jgi:ribosome modulation factor